MKALQCVPIGELMRSAKPRSVVTIEGGVIWIRASYPYPIEASRIVDARDVIAWVHHLSGKTWATRDLIAEFIEVVARAKGINTRIKG